MSASSISLRERSKAKRRAAIQRAALRLFGERGYDATTIADIAEEAEVAPRTVRMYFPNKIDIAMSASDDIASRLAEIFEAHPGMPFTEAVDLWIRREARAVNRDLARMIAKMHDANPSMRSETTAHMAEVSRVAHLALLAEMGLPDDDPLATIATTAVGAALTEYVITALRAGVPQDLHESFMRYLRAIIRAAQPS
ncbi:TetR/AcrR family transcriptional regulator [Streptomyces phaeochromogenes]|uniref:TetR/AcrR family transcriptional regulator n=1 Tax=Streptomyces phaeochromogenes TaxID=1923 RepID=UPI0033C5B2C6